MAIAVSASGKTKIMNCVFHKILSVTADDKLKYNVIGLEAAISVEILLLLTFMIYHH
jgi:hypothetical protein